MMELDIFNFRLESLLSDLTVGKLGFVYFLAAVTRDSMNIVAALSGTRAVMLQNANKAAGDIINAPLNSETYLSNPILPYG
jgi:hypothetical protein